MDFLTGRSQKVVLNNTCSESTSVLSGVPQGSILGPLLFLPFINDLPDVVSSQLKLYADDALLHRTISSEDDVQALQQDLNSLSEWAQDGKCVAIHPNVYIFVLPIRHSPSHHYIIFPVTPSPTPRYFAVGDGVTGNII